MYRGIGGICFATILFVCSVTGFPIAPDQRPPAVGQVTVTQGGAPAQTLFAGSQAVVRGTGYHPNSNLTVALYSKPSTLAEVTTDAAGSFSASITIPKSTPTGAHTISAIGLAPDQTARVLEAAVTVKPRPITPTALVRTGVNTAFWTMVGIALCGIGLVLTRTAALRRRILPVV